MITDGTNPLNITWPGVFAGLAARYNPMDAGEIEVGQRAYQRLA
jgi:hypothetical protein